MASSSNNNQGNNSSDESNEIFQSSEVPQSAQNFDDDLVPMDMVDDLYFTASEEFITRSLSQRQHRITTPAVSQDLFPSETITENRPTTGSEDMFPTEPLTTRGPRESTPSGSSPDNIVASDEDQVYLSQGNPIGPKPKRHKASSSSSTTDDDINVHQSQGPGTSMKDSSSTEYITQHHPSTSSTEYITQHPPSTATMALIDETVRKILNEEASSTDDEPTGQAVTPLDISTDEEPSQPILTHELFSEVLSHISSHQSPSRVDTRNNEQRASLFVARCIKTIEDEAGCNISHEQATFMFVMIISQYLNEYCKKSKPDHVEEMKKHIEKQCEDFFNS